MAFFARAQQKVLKQLLALVNDKSQPNLNALNDIAKDVRLIELNLKAFGYDLARRLAAALPPATDTVARHVGLRSKPATQADMESDWAAHWAAQLKVPIVFHRKLWELTFVLQALYEGGFLRDGARGLGFGCGKEPIASYLASQGVAVTVTDLPEAEAEAKGWLKHDQHAGTLDQAFHPELIDREPFDRLVTLRVADMNAIPAELAGYDFCWSLCAMEHLGSIAKGLDFLEASLATLRPGGLSVHTMEFNVDPEGPTVDNWVTVLFQRRHVEAIAERLRRQGHEVAELDFFMGDKPMDRFIDLPPWSHELPPSVASGLGEPLHLKVGIDGFVSTCFGLIIRKAA